MDKKTLTLIMKLAAITSGFKTKDYRVLLYLLPKLRKGKLIKINQAKIADELDIAKTDVSKSIKKLIEGKILCLEDQESGWKVNIKLYPYSEEIVKAKIDEILFDYDEQDYDYE